MFAVNRAVLFLLVLCFSLFVASAASAALWTVPEDVGCETVQGCIQLASEGDTITVNPGVYGENIDFLGKGITLQSRDGPDVTTLDGNFADTVVTFASGEGNGSVLEGFKITNAGHMGGSSAEPIYGIYCLDASPIIRGNLITNLSMEDGAYLAGILVDGGAPVISGNRVIENMVGAYASGAGYGIYIVQEEGSDAAIISGNEIFSNGAGCQHPMGFCSGAGILFGGENIEITNNMIITNGGSGGYGTGYGVNCSGNHIVFSHNTVVASAGFGVMIEADNSATVLNNIVAYHLEYQFSFGLCVTGDGSLTEDYNCLWMNEGDYCTTPGPHNVSKDPLFVDPRPYYSDADYHLQEGSPCINRGTDAGVTEDIDGDVRPQGFGFDIGADEVQKEPWGVAPEAAASTGPGRSTVFSKTVNPLLMGLLPLGLVFFLRFFSKKEK